MPRRLSASAELTLDQKSVETFVSILVNGASCLDVMTYSYSFNKQFGAASSTIGLANQDGKYGVNGANEIKYGDTIRVIEGLYNYNRQLESFNRFEGIVRQISPQISGGEATLELTIVDKIGKLESLEVEKIYESVDEKVYTIPSLTYGGVPLLESNVEGEISTLMSPGTDVILNKIVSGSGQIDTTDGFEVGYAYVGSQIDAHKVYIKEANAQRLVIENLTFTIAIGSMIRQSMSQRDSTSGRGNLFDFGKWVPVAEATDLDFPNDFGGATTYYFQRVKNISPTKLPVLTVRQTDTNGTHEDPQWDGFEINYAEGQVVLGRLLNTNAYSMWAQVFYYYPDGSIQYAEDIIEDIILLPDGYGDLPFTAADIQTTLMVEDGASDYLTYNRSESLINGVSYPSGQVWYHKYNNVQSLLGTGNYVLPGGASIDTSLQDNPSQRYGRVVLTAPVASPSDGNVLYLADYTFKTLQATGVMIPIIDLTEQKSRFDAITELKKQLAPNYIIKSSGDGKIWGSHLRQRAVKDYDLKLIQSLTYTSETEEIYTRVKRYGENAVPKNVMTDATYSVGDCYVVFAQNMPLVWTGATQTVGNKQFYEFTIPDTLINDRTLGAILNVPTPPAVWINGVKNSTWAIDNLPFECWGYIKLDGVTTEETQEVDTCYVGFYFNMAVDFNQPLTFYYNGMPFSFEVNGVIRQSVYLRELDFKNDGSGALSLDSKNGIYKWRPDLDPNVTADQWKSATIEKITSITMTLNYSTSWSYAPTNDNPYRFLVNKEYCVIDEAEGFSDISRKGGVGVENVTFVGNRSYSHSSHPEAALDGIKFKSESLDGAYFMCRQDGMTSENNFGSNYMSYEIPLLGAGVISHIDFVLSKASGMHDGNMAILYWDTFNNAWRFISPITAPYTVQDNVGDNENVYIKRWKLPFVYTDRFQVRVAAERYRLNIDDWFTAAVTRVHEIYVWKYQGGYNITSDFWYRKSLDVPSAVDMNKLHDGLWTTQLQTMYTYDPLGGTRYITFNMPTYIKDGVCDFAVIDAIDIAAGWFIPNSSDANRKYEISNKYSIEWYDGENWYPLGGTEGTNFDLSSGDIKSFEEDSIKPHKIAIILEKCTKLENFGPNRWIVALTEFSAYKDIKLTAEAKLIPATKLTTGCGTGDTTIEVKSTEQFPASGIAYIGDQWIIYAGKTATTFTGVTGATAYDEGARVSLRLETDLSPDVYDPDDLLSKFGDKVYKDTEVSKYLNTQEKLNDMTKLFLRELCMAITTVEAPAYRPDACIGDTVLIHDPINTAEDQLYFIDEISNQDGSMSFKLAKYWSLDQEDS